jgi:flagellar biosynthesis chaperone FliJ
LAEVRKMIEETRKKLAEIKVANSKSSALIEKAEKHLEKISQKAEVKTSDLIDQPDSDLDEVIWAF